MSKTRETSMNCPQCKEQGDIHQIIYGMPSGDFDFDKYEVGGCVIFNFHPNWRCRNCRWEGERKPRRKPDPSRDPREKLGRFYAARAESSLKREQTAGYHWGYLTGEDKTHCTCGLTIDPNDPTLKAEMVHPEIDLDLPPIVLLRGHRQLPGRKGSATCLIVQLRLLNQGSQHIATAFCQGCRKVIQDVDLADAQEFVDEHEQTCGGSQAS